MKFNRTHYIDQHNNVHIPNRRSAWGWILLLALLTGLNCGATAQSIKLTGNVYLKTAAGTNLKTDNITVASTSQLNISGSEVTVNGNINIDGCCSFTSAGSTVMLSGTSPHIINTTGDVSFATLVLNPGADVQLTSGNTYTTTDLQVAGISGNNIIIASTTGGSEATFSQSSGTVAGDYLELTDIHATGGATFNAENSIDNGNNVGWNFLAAAPTITAFSPTSGPTGTEITITGTNFNSTFADNSVYFGAIKATPTSGTTTSLTVNVPPGATSVTPIFVQDNTTGLSANSIETVTGSFAQQFTITNSPTLSLNYTSSTIALSTAPQSIVLGDFNEDGNADFVTANSGSDDVIVRLGDGAGGFSGSTTVSVGNDPTAIVLGDFNGDGHFDFATANQSSNNVSIRLGDGSGGFSGSNNISVGNTPVAIAIGDFNLDGFQDLATANLGASTVSVRLGDGTGGFTGTTNVSVGSNPGAIAIGDFDNDGIADLATANFLGNDVSIRLGDGAGDFTGSTSISVGTAPFSIALGDFNGDDDLDFAAANQSSASVSIKFGDGTGGFSGFVDIAVGPNPISVVVGDFDGDGNTDFANANLNGDNVSIRLGNGLGGFSGSTNISVGTDPVSLAVGDFNNDGGADIAVANETSNDVSVLINAPPVTTLTSSNPTANANNIARDANIVLNFDTNIAQSTIDNGTAGDPTDDNIIISGEQTGLIPGTYTGDGTATITFNPIMDFKPGEIITVTMTSAVQNTSGVNLTPKVFRFNTISTLSSGFFSSEKVISLSSDFPEFVRAADMDGDGDVDILSAAQLNDRVSWHDNDGLVFTENVLSLTSIEATSVYPIDMDGDGDMDAISSAINQGEIAWYDNDGAENFTKNVISLTAQSSRSAYAADIDLDGDFDALSAAVFFDEVSWYENDGSEGFTENTIGCCHDGAHTVYATDIDNDGDMDVFSSLQNENKLVWFENDGSLGFTERLVNNTTNFARGIFAIDVDDDGDMDLMGTSTGKVAWYENDGNENFTEIVISTGSAFGIYASDVDGDNDIDILVAFSGDDKISWFENDGDETFTEREIATAINGPSSIYTADMDNDGDLDVLATIAGEDKIVWYEQLIPLPGISQVYPLSASAAANTEIRIYGDNLNESGSTLTLGSSTITPISISDKAIIFDVPDITPGVYDLIVTTDFGATDPYRFTVLEKDLGQRQFNAPQTISNTINTPTDLALADLNGDDYTDILVYSLDDLDLFYYENDQSFGFQAPVTVYNGSAGFLTTINTGDLDGDAIADIAFIGNEELLWIKGNGNGTFAAAAAVATGSNFRDLALGDIDQDGIIDLVAIENGVVKWYKNDEAAGFSTGVIMSSTPAAGKLILGDVDNDGDLDVMQANNTNFFVRNNNAATFDVVTLSTTTNGSGDALVADFSGNGFIDFMAGSFNDSNVDLYLNNGSGTLQNSPTDLNPSNTYVSVSDFALVDIEGDADFDLLTAFYNGTNNIILYKNDGSASFGAEVLVTAQSQISGVESADLDLDGDMDMVFIRENGELNIAENIPLNAFITTWITTDGEITIPTVGTGFNYDITWTNITGTGGDGSDTGVGDAPYTITGLNNGDTYQVEITGVFPSMAFSNVGDKDKILTVEQWGDIAWTSMRSMFYGCTQLTVPATDAPDLSLVTDIGFMFSGATSFNQSIDHWDVSTIINMDNTFEGATQFNQPLNSWITSSLLNCSNLFKDANAFNQPLNNWDMDQVEEMNGVFFGASSFNEDITTWDPTSVNTTATMFFEATSFNQDISGWDVSNISNMSSMFRGATGFNQNISGWVTTGLTRLTSMFQDATIFNQDISGWNVSNVDRFDAMFLSATSFSQNLGAWNIGSATNMFEMFNNSGMSRPDYDATLIGWADDNGGTETIPMLTSFFGADGLEYCAAAAARQNLIDNFGWNFTIAGDSENCPEATLTQLTNGIAPDPLTASDADQAVLGFSLLSDGTQILESLDFTASTDPSVDPLLTNFRLFSSADDTYDGGDVSLGSVSSGTTLSISGLSEDLSTIKYYFLVADVDAGVSAASSNIQFTLADAGVTLDAGSVTGGPVTGIDYSFDAGSATPTISQISPTSGPVGTLVTVTGTNLGDPTNLQIASVQAVEISNDGTTLVGFVMPGATSGSVDMTTAGGSVSSAQSFMVTTPAPTSMLQIGANIDGEAAGDASGRSVSLSADGQILAIGADNNDGTGTDAGHVRVYQNDGGTWTQLGNDIDGEAALDQSGISLSLSADGQTLAIGAWLNDGAGGNSGHVRIYDWNGSAWVQIGSDIDGEAAGDASGWSVSLSANGQTLAIGAWTNDGAGSDAGHVRVYQDNAGIWTQIGNDIDGEAAGDRFGNSVSLSADGQTLAIGAYQNDGNGADAGHVRVYENNAGTWTQIGADIDGEALGDQSGQSVSLSADGQTLAIGAPENDGAGSNAGHVRVYQNNAGTWTQIGSDINGESGFDRSGQVVSLSADGQTLAIGAINNSATGTNAGHVRIYKNNAATWVQIGSDIDGEAADDWFGSVSLSADGQTLATGAIFNDGAGLNAGHVRVFELINIETALTQLTNGIAPDPLTASDADQAVLGFSLLSDGTQILESLDFTASTDPSVDPLLTNFRLFSSTDDTYDAGDASIGAVSSGTTLTISGLSEDLSTIKYYFLVADVDAGVSAASSNIQFSLADPGVTVDAGSVTGGPVSGTDYSFSSADACVAIDRAALIALYNATDGPNWDINTDWNTAAPLDDWHGITTNAQGCVTVIDLSDNNLTGPIPVELGSISNLTQLFLGLNNLNGTIPAELRTLTNLVHLGLEGNALSGSIPPELGEMSNLGVFAVNENDLTGNIPSELGDLTNLTYLGLQNNEFDGALPTTLGSLTILNSFYAFGNNLNGTIPSSLGSLSQLQILDLGSNSFTGSVPATLGDLSNLQELFLPENDITGPLPANLTNLGALTDFDFSLTDVCEPQDATFQTWKSGIGNYVDNGTICETLLTSATNGVAADPLTAGATNQALIGFGLSSTASPTLSALSFTSTSEPDGKLITANWGLFSSVDNDFSTTGDNSQITGLTITTPTATSISVTGLSESITDLESYYFLVADVDASVTGSTPQIQLSLNETGITITEVPVTPVTVSGLNYSFEGISISAANTTLSKTGTADILSDGTAFETINVQLKDGAGNNFTQAGIEVRFAATAPGATANSERFIDPNGIVTTSAGNMTVLSNAAGLATVRITNTEAELVSITARIDTNDDDVVDADVLGGTVPVTVNFVAPPAPISVAATGSTIAADPLSVQANSDESSTITIQLRDVDGNNLARPGINIQVAATGNALLDGAGSPIVISTNASGLATAVIANAVAESVNIAARIDLDENGSYISSEQITNGGSSGIVTIEFTPDPTPPTLSNVALVQINQAMGIDFAYQSNEVGTLHWIINRTLTSPTADAIEAGTGGSNGAGSFEVTTINAIANATVVGTGLQDTLYYLHLVIEDVDGNYSNVADISWIADGTRPIVQSATVETATPNLVTVSLSEAVEYTELTGFTLTSQAGNTLEASVSASTDGRTLTFTLATALIQGDLIFLNYNPSLGDVRDAANNFLAEISLLPVDNNIEGIPPTISGLEITSINQAEGVDIQFISDRVGVFYWVITTADNVNTVEQFEAQANTFGKNSISVNQRNVLNRAEIRGNNLENDVTYFLSVYLEDNFNNVSSFSSVSWTADDEAPEIISAVIEDATPNMITVSLSQAFNVLDTGQFSLDTPEGAAGPTVMGFNVGANNTIILTLARNVTQAEELRLYYVSGAKGIIDPANNPVPDTYQFPIINNVLDPPPVITNWEITGVVNSQSVTLSYAVDQTSDLYWMISSVETQDQQVIRLGTVTNEGTGSITVTQPGIQLEETFDNLQLQNEVTYFIQGFLENDIGNVSEIASASWTVDGTAPQLTAAVIEDAALDQIVLTFSEAIVINNTQGWSLANADGQAAIGINGFEVLDDETVLLGLSREITILDDLFISYASSSGQVQDLATNALQDINDYAVETSIVATPPVITNLSVIQVNELFGVDIRFETDKAGTIYWLVSEDPSVTNIEDIQFQDFDPFGSDNFAVTAGIDSANVRTNPLQDSTTYYLHLFQVDEFLSPSEIYTISWVTPSGLAPQLDPVMIADNDNEFISIQYTSSDEELLVIYYVIYAQAQTNVTKSAVKNRTDGGQGVIAYSGNFVAGTGGTFAEAVSLDPPPEEGVEYFVYLFGENQDGEETALATVSFIPEALPEIPEPLIRNLITPNGDGANDMLHIEQLRLIPGDKTIYMYDRQGKNVLTIQGYRNNDETHLDKFARLIPGPYQCILQLADGTTYRQAIIILKE